MGESKRSGDGTGLVARLVFKTCVRPEEGLGWVRFPHIPANTPAQPLLRMQPDTGCVSRYQFSTAGQIAEIDVILNLFQDPSRRWADAE